MASLRRRLERLWPTEAGGRLLLAYLLCAAAVWVAAGSLRGLPYALASLAVVIAAIRRPGASSPPSPRLLTVAVALSTLGAVVRPPGAYLPPSAPLWLFALLALVKAGHLFLAAKGRLAPRRALALVALIFVVEGGLMLHLVPAPRIDVFVLGQDAARELLDGHSPYSARFPNPYDEAETLAFYGRPLASLDGYPYPPLTLLLTTLSYLLGGDVRWLLLVAQLATGLLLFPLARRHRGDEPTALALAALPLVAPGALFVLEQAWVDPLLGLGLVASLLLLASPRRGGIALGLTLALKQTSVLLLPLALIPRLVPRRSLAIALTVAALVTVPFVLWDPRGFLDDVILLQLRQPFRMDALSIAPVVAHLTGWQAPGGLSFVAALVAGAWAARRLPAGARGFALGAALSSFAFFIVAKQAFANYYHFVGVALLAAAATAGGEGSAAAGEVPRA